MNICKKQFALVLIILYERVLIEFGPTQKIIDYIADARVYVLSVHVQCMALLKDSTTLNCNVNVAKIRTRKA